MIYKKLIRPALFERDPEEIHDRVIRILRSASDTAGLYGFLKMVCNVCDGRLKQELFGLTFRNPVGLAAGMDKGGTALLAWEMLGFGFVEIGGITALKQLGNPEPRIFRVPEEEALINRMGFNNPGAEETAYHLGAVRKPSVPLFINIGLSKAVPVDDMEAVVHDYCYTLNKLYEYADAFVVNVSSPNTLNLRRLQGKEFLRILLKGIQRQNLKVSRRPDERLKPILLKISPDLTFQEIDEILEVIGDVGIDGIVAVNTTTKRDELKTTSVAVNEIGGLSGRPLRWRALEIVAYIHKKFPSLPIVGVGGIFSGEDAYRMIYAGASLVQICTGLVYEGPGLARRINKTLLAFMSVKLDGIGPVSVSNLNQVVNRL